MTLRRMTSEINFRHQRWQDFNGSMVVVEIFAFDRSQYYCHKQVGLTDQGEKQTFNDNVSFQSFH